MTNNKTHSKNINGGLPESQSHQSWPPIVSTHTKILTAVATEKITHTHTQNIGEKNSQHVSSAKQQKIINKPGYISVSVRVHK